MNIFGDMARWALIGGPSYPREVERVLSGDMQARTAHSRTRKEKDVMVHPDYTFNTLSYTVSAIMGAFTLRIIGADGMKVDELEEYETSNEIIPNLELLDNEPMTCKLLGLSGGARFLKIGKLVTIKNGMISTRDKGAQMLEDNPYQAYTVFPEELHQRSGQDINGEYTYRPMNESITETAARVYNQYTPHYKNVFPID